MGRAPCCDKASVKKGPWSPEEDAKLKSYIEQYGTGGNWIALPQKIGLKRCGKSCRLRWLNYLRPNIKHGGFSEEEDNIICSLYITIGSRWSIIAAQLPGRTDNDIKNYWNTRLKKKLLGKQKKDSIVVGVGSHQIIPRRSVKEDQDDHGSFPAIQNGALIAAASSNNSSYWPAAAAVGFLPMSSMAIPAMNGTNDQHIIADDKESFRKLLLRLGGRTFDEGTDHCSTQLPLQPPSLNHHHQDPATSSSLVVGQTPNTVSFADNNSSLPGLNGIFSTELDELFQCSNSNQVKLESSDNYNNIFGSSFLDESCLNWSDQVSVAAAMCAPLMVATSSSSQQQLAAAAAAARVL